MNSFYSDEELQKIGFKEIGQNVLISRKASIYSPEKMVIGSHVRIDDFCILSGHIELKDYVHIAAYVALFGANVGIYIDSFVGISSRSAIYAATDDYSGTALTNPTIPDIFRNIIEKSVQIEKHAIIGTGSTILPGVTLHEGVSVGAMSLISKNLEPWSIYVGIPAKKIKDREKTIIQKEVLFLENENLNSICSEILCKHVKSERED